MLRKRPTRPSSTCVVWMSWRRSLSPGTEGAGVPLLLTWWRVGWVFCQRETEEWFRSREADRSRFATPVLCGRGAHGLHKDTIVFTAAPGGAERIQGLYRVPAGYGQPEPLAIPAHEKGEGLQLSEDSAPAGKVVCSMPATKMVLRSGRCHGNWAAENRGRRGHQSLLRVHRPLGLPAGKARSRSSAVWLRRSNLAVSR